MEIKLACADFTFPLLEHEHSLDLIASMGFDGVDIGFFENRSHLWPSREFTNTDRNAKRLKTMLEDRGLQAADLFLQMDADLEPFAINHPDSLRREKARDWFKRSLAYAMAIGARHLTALPGMPFGDDALAVSIEELAWRVDLAKEHGLAFGIEAHVGSIVPDPASALALVEAVPGLTLTLDYTHFTRNGIPDVTVEPMIAKASHFHARGASKGRLQASFKDNVVDYARIVERMRDTGYTGWIGVEYVWIDWEQCNECDNISETILFRDFFRTLA